MDISMYMDVHMEYGWMNKYLEYLYITKNNIKETHIEVPSLKLNSF